MRTFTDQELVRREKAENLKKKGINPFGSKFNITSDSLEIKTKFDAYSKEELEEVKEEVIIAGRIMTKRRSGKAGFMHILDKHGQIQIYINLNNVGEDNYELAKTDI